MSGCTKKMKINRKVLQQNGTLEMEEKILTVDVKRGWREGTKITFSKEGHQGKNKVPADVIFILKDKEHPFFVRNGDDLHYTAKISLKQALCGATISIPTLYNKTFIINSSNEILSPKTKRIYKGYGLPNHKDFSQVGDLIVTFDIKFPECIPLSVKDCLLTGLP